MQFGTTNLREWRKAPAWLCSLLLLGPLAAPRAEVISGRVVDSLGNGVAGVNIDVLNFGSGGDPDVFNDGTDANGFFTTTVSEAGIFHVYFKPPPPPTTTHLVLEEPDVVVVGNLVRQIRAV